MSLQIEVVVSDPFGENTYIAYQQGSREAVVVDPGFDPQAVSEALRSRRLSVVAILNTHGHLDHIAGNAALKGEFPSAPLIIGAGDAAMLTDPILNASAKYGMHVVSPPADRTVDEGDVLSLVGVDWQVRAIPGHSPGHIVFIGRMKEETVVFGGDVLFAGGIGRYDMPGGDGPLLVRGIHEKLYSLPDSAVVFPGHGPETTVGEEKRNNPFTNGMVRI